MGFNMKLVLAGLAVGVTAYITRLPRKTNAKPLRINIKSAQLPCLLHRDPIRMPLHGVA